LARSFVSERCPCALQQEESKAWKKIAQTKDRAQEILDMRLASLQRQEEKSMHAVERERQSRSAQKKQFCLKKESVIKKKHAAIQVISKKYQDVEQVKTESKRLKAERERLQLLQVERARAKRQTIRKQEDALKKKKLLDRQQVDDPRASEEGARDGGGRARIDPAAPRNATHPTRGVFGARAGPPSNRPQARPLCCTLGPNKPSSVTPQSLPRLHRIQYTIDCNSHALPAGPNVSLA